MVPRLAIYTAISTSLFSAVTISALNSRPNFYAAAISVGRNSGAMMVVWNMIIWAGLVVGLGVRRLFFGQLRSIEHEVCPSSFRVSPSLSSHSFWTILYSWIVPVSHSYRLSFWVVRLRQAAGAVADDGLGVIRITTLHSFSKLFSLRRLVVSETGIGKYLDCTLPKRDFLEMMKRAS